MDDVYHDYSSIHENSESSVKPGYGLADSSERFIKESCSYLFPSNLYFIFEFSFGICLHS